GPMAFEAGRESPLLEFPHSGWWGIHGFKISDPRGDDCRVPGFLCLCFTLRTCTQRAQRSLPASQVEWLDVCAPARHTASDWFSKRISAVSRDPGPAGGGRAGGAARRQKRVGLFSRRCAKGVLAAH